MSITLYNDDCIERMKKLPDKSIDLFITDLPYASKKFGKCVSCKWDTPIELDDMWKQYKRLRKSKNTPMFFFCNVKHGVDLINSNPKMFRRELVWIKSSPTGFLNARRMELKKTEYIYVFYEKLPFYDISSHKHKFIKHYPCRKGQEEGCIYGKVKKIDAKGYDPQLPTNLIEYEPPLPNNVMRIKSVKKGLHPTQKPVSIIERILKYYSKPGWNVLDMCCGSGSTGVACKNMGRNFIGIELDKKIFDICKKRLDNEIV